MKSVILALVSFIFLESCESIDEDINPQKNINTLPEIASYDFLKLQKEPNFEVVHLDSLDNFTALIRALEQLSCKNKNTAVQFTQNDTIYKLTSFVPCPDDQGVACYFNVNRIFIKNDSLQSLTGNWNTLQPIRELRNEIEQLTKNEFSFRWDENICKPALIELFIDEKYSITKTKEVLKEITQTFKKVNTANGADYFKYYIIYTNRSWLDVPPPPPPPVPEIVEVVD